MRKLALLATIAAVVVTLKNKKMTALADCVENEACMTL